MKFKEAELKSLFDRVYNGKMIVDEERSLNDAQDIETYIKKVFGDGGKNPDPSLLHQFNNLVVEKADEVAKPKVTNLLSILSNVQSRNRGDVVKIDLPKKAKAKFIWSANGSGVDLVRVAGQETTVAVPRTFTTGFYYEPEDLVQDSVEKFKELINDVADAKIRKYFEEFSKLINAAITNSSIPSANVHEGTDLDVAGYNKVASTLSRYGGRPVFIADSLMIDHFAMKFATDTTYKGLIYEDYKKELLTDLNISTLGRTDAMNLVNPFIDDNNDSTELPVNEGYMVAGESRVKPFSIVEYGATRQTSNQDFETERVMVKIAFDAAINLVAGHILGYIKDESIIL